jgi:iron complex outermembrane receptor protein
MVVGVCLLVWAVPAGAAPPAQDTVPLRELSLEQLGEIVVTSVSKRVDDLWGTPAAVAVITADDIRRSGATSLPEVLRMAAGVEVARVDASHYSIGIRGFGEQFSKSVLVLVDGRNLYNQLFAGTYWPAHDVMLEDVERIEVIRGPGGTIWGGNAVNGVINVITRRAEATRGALVSVGGGTVDHGSAAVRYGGAGRGLDYRVYAKAFLRGPQFHRDGSDFDDNWWLSQAGFRVDRASTGRGSLTLAGALNTGGHGQRVRVATFAPAATGIVDAPVDTSGGHLLARWDHRIAATDLQIQSYYDRTVWRAPHFAETRDTADVDVLQSARVAARHQLSGGGGLRWSAGPFSQTIETLDFSPDNQTDWLVSAFVRDEVHLLPDRLSVLAGTKIEHNSYTGLEWQPSARLLWRVRPTQTVWLAATRAVRTPSRIERSIQLSSLALTTPLPAYLQIRGSDQFESERTVSYAAGYRVLAGAPLFVDLSVFVNEHRDLAGFSRLATQIVTSPGPLRAVVPLPYINAIDGTSSGFELAPEWRAAAAVRVSGSYAFRRIALEARPENIDAQAVPRYEGSSPAHLVRVQTRLDLPRRIELDAAYRYVSALPFRLVDAYHTTDLRLGWRPSPQLELSVTGHNLLQPHHLEFAHDPGPPVGIARSAAVQVVWHTAAR